MSTRCSWGWLFLHARRFHSNRHVYPERFTNALTSVCAGDLFKIASEVVLETIQVAYKCFPYSVQHIYHHDGVSDKLHVYWKLVLKESTTIWYTCRICGEEWERCAQPDLPQSEKNLLLLMKLKAVKKQLTINNIVQMLNMIFNLQLLATVIRTFFEITYGLYFYIMAAKRKIHEQDVENIILRIPYSTYDTLLHKNNTDSMGLWDK